MPTSNATSRFSDRVENYVLYRPGYPPEALQTLQTECGLAPADVVADFASGTGIWSRVMLENGNSVFGVEPMPRCAKPANGSCQDFRGLPASQELPKLLLCRPG